MRSPQAKIGIVTGVLVVLTLGLLVYSVLQQTQTTCEACVTFHGRTQCRAAIGPDRDQAVKTAIDNACGFLASGMADGISCANTPPDSVTCDD
jgi:hypothetical protein